MFANTKAFSGFAVDDLEAAKKFYGLDGLYEGRSSPGSATAGVPDAYPDQHLPQMTQPPRQHTALSGTQAAQQRPARRRLSGPL